MTTENISRFSIDPTSNFKEEQQGPVKLTLFIDSDPKEKDAKGLEIEWTGSGSLHFEKSHGAWKKMEDAPSSSQKNPARYGPFKQAFDRHFILVYGTGGTAEENKAALARARFDAQVWWYRGNGAALLIPDTKFKTVSEEDRNVILYGHADMNSVFNHVVDATTLQVHRGRIKLGGKELRGKALSCLITVPRKGSKAALVGIVGGTSAAGIRGTLLGSYFRSGIQYPDMTIWGGETIQGKNYGVKAAGFFGTDWTVESGEFWFGEGWESATPPRKPKRRFF